MTFCTEAAPRARGKVNQHTICSAFFCISGFVKRGKLYLLDPDPGLSFSLHLKKDAQLVGGPEVVAGLVRGELLEILISFLCLYCLRWTD